MLLRRPDPDAPRDAAACRDLAVGLLARREHSRTELERKLAERRFPGEIVNAVLDELAAAGVLADKRFTTSFIEARAGKGQGPVRIRAELLERGIAKDEAAARLEQAGVDWAEQARVARRKRFGEVMPADFRERARQARFLEYRGFERSQIAAALGGEDE